MQKKNSTWFYSSELAYHGAMPFYYTKSGARVPWNSLISIDLKTSIDNSEEFCKWQSRYLSKENKCSESDNAIYHDAVRKKLSLIHGQIAKWVVLTWSTGGFWNSSWVKIINGKQSRSCAYTPVTEGSGSGSLLILILLQWLAFLLYLNFFFFLLLKKEIMLALFSKP